MSMADKSTSTDKTPAEASSAFEVQDPEWDNFFHVEESEFESLDAILGRIPLFSLLSRRELRRLASRVHRRRFKAGETVIYRGVEQLGFYLIRSGSVNIVRQDADGRRRVVGSLGPHELIGEFALIDGAPRSSAVVAAESSELVGFFKPDLTDIMVTRPQMGCRILLGLATEMSYLLKSDYEKLLKLGLPFDKTDKRPNELTTDPTQT
jgi:CRP/FNR family transcriptional regulator, cyclic AMP receptor protein